MKFEWDPDKARTNKTKHRVDFADATTALFDERAITVLDDVSGEERHVTMGLDALGRVLVVVYTWRGDTMRLISARKANPSERRSYEEDV